MKDAVKDVLKDVVRLFLKCFVMIFILPIYKVSLFISTVCCSIAEKIDNFFDLIEEI